MKKISRFVVWFGIMVIIMLAGTSGFMLIEHYPLLEAVYMTVITIATIGYQEVKPLSPQGMLFNIIFIISSFAFFTYALTSLTRYVVSGEMAAYFKKRKLMKSINNFSDHVIVCGFGRHGQQASKILQLHNIDFVVIDTHEARLAEWQNENKDLVYIQGDAMQDEILVKAGIKKARAILLNLPTDADNVFIVLSARYLNPNFVIISRAQHKSTINKLKTAGADHVILPEMIGGSHMATLVSKPDVIEFINSLWGDDAESINIESVAYEELPDELKDKSIFEVTKWNNTGVSCLGIKNARGKFIINPPGDTLIQNKMKIMLFGTMYQIAEAKRLLKLRK
ncbi:potassium channel protein [soil metagenome]